MFGAMCRSPHVFPFRMFNHIVKGVDWSQHLAHSHVGSPLPIICANTLHGYVATAHHP